MEYWTNETIKNQLKNIINKIDDKLDIDFYETHEKSEVLEVFLENIDWELKKLIKKTEKEE